MYTLTAHARRRIRQRRIPWSGIVNALAEEAQPIGDGIWSHYDPVLRVVLVVMDDRIVTAYRMKPEGLDTRGWFYG